MKAQSAVYDPSSNEFVINMLESALNTGFWSLSPFYSVYFRILSLSEPLSPLCATDTNARSFAVWIFSTKLTDL